MSRRIQEDHKEFRDVVGGKIDEEIKKFIKNGKLVGWRPNKGRFIINVPRIDLPSFRFGRDSGGWGRGPGKPGDVVGKDPVDGKDKGKPGKDPGDTVPVGIDLQYILDYMKEELELPNMEPKECTDVFDEKLIYNGIRKTGPESLRHNRRTMRQAMLRMIQSGEYDDKDPVICPVQSDKRYKSWNIKKIPRSNAVIFFARDWSGSMDDRKCEMVMNTCWWLDQWIRQFYKRTEAVYIGHDTEAQEIDQEKFYKQRYGGGTKISSAFSLIKDKIEFNFNPSSWNIYIFYFSDGENYNSDNNKCIELLKELSPTCNLLGIGQILNFMSFFASNGSFLELIEKEFNNEINKGLIRTYNSNPENTGEDEEECFNMIKAFLSTNWKKHKNETTDSVAAAE